MDDLTKAINHLTSLSCTLEEREVEMEKVNKKLEELRGKFLALEKEFPKSSPAQSASSSSSTSSSASGEKAPQTPAEYFKKTISKIGPEYAEIIGELLLLDGVYAFGSIVTRAILGEKWLTAPLNFICLSPISRVTDILTDYGYFLASSKNHFDYNPVGICDSSRDPALIHHFPSGWKLQSYSKHQSSSQSISDNRHMIKIITAPEDVTDRIVSIFDLGTLSPLSFLSNFFDGKSFYICNYLSLRFRTHFQDLAGLEPSAAKGLQKMVDTYYASAGFSISRSVNSASDSRLLVPGDTPYKSNMMRSIRKSVSFKEHSKVLGGLSSPTMLAQFAKVLCRIQGRRDSTIPGLLYGQIAVVVGPVVMQAILGEDWVECTSIILRVLEGREADLKDALSKAGYDRVCFKDGAIQYTHPSTGESLFVLGLGTQTKKTTFDGIYFDGHNFFVDDIRALIWREHHIPRGGLLIYQTIHTEMLFKSGFAVFDHVFWNFGIQRFGKTGCTVSIPGSHNCLNLSWRIDLLITEYKVVQ